MPKTKAQIEQENAELKAQLAGANEALAAARAARGEQPTIEVRVNRGSDLQYGVLSVAKKTASGVYLKGGFAFRTWDDAEAFTNDMLEAVAQRP